MRNPSVISVFERLSEQLSAIDHMLDLAHALAEDATAAGRSQYPLLQELTQRLETLDANLDWSLRELRQRIDQSNLLYEIISQFQDNLSLHEVVESTMDALWQRIPLEFAVMVLGESELGPFHYQSMRGIPESARYLGQICNFPLWGVLAHALIPRLDPQEEDYLIIGDIENEDQPLPEEFPWLVRRGSLAIFPLRGQGSVIGALILGRNAVNDFDNPGLCQDLYDIAGNAARAVQFAQMRQEMNERATQLVGLQLFTKSVAAAQSLEELLNMVALGVLEITGEATVHLALLSQDAIRDEVTAELSEQHLLDALTVHFLSASGELPINEASHQFMRLAVWVIQAGEPVLFEPNVLTSGTQSMSPEELYYNETGHALFLPITSGERTLGAIHVSAPNRARQFDEGDIVVLRTMMNCVAVTLHHRFLQQNQPDQGSDPADG